MEFGINRHAVEGRTCPQCQTDYLVQLGGQKSGMSPAVHVGKVEVVGYCSERCQVEASGGVVEGTLVYKAFEDWGLNYDEIFPRGYLAPARRSTITPDSSLGLPDG